MDDLSQTLRDAGCDAEHRSAICRLYNAGQIRETIQALRRHRCGLMDQLHESQERVDRLDQLLYQMEKEWKSQPHRERMVL